MDERLKEDKVDLVTAGLKSVVGAIPIVGSAVAEIIGAVIPNQRVDRMAGFVHDLAEKLKDVSEEQIRQRMLREENVDLFEESLIQATRALSPERRRQIAALFKNGITRTDLDHGHKKHLLALLGELNDAELLILKYLDYETDREAFEELHGDTLFAETVVLGASEDEVGRAAAHESFWDHLRQLRLIAPPPRGGSDQITSLGHLLLSYVDEVSDSAANDVGGYSRLKLSRPGSGPPLKRLGRTKPARCHVGCKLHPRGC